MSLYIELEGPALLSPFVLQPERIDPPDPTKPDYDIRADVWSLGISLVNLPSF